MRKNMTIWAIAGAVALAGTVACTAEQTQEAKAPDVDMDVEAGQWPQYDVKWADVDVGTTERTVTVPVVKVEQEQRQVSVPYIDINPPNARDREERTVAFDVDVPHAGYTLQIAEVRASGDDLWVIARLTEGEGTSAAQATTRVSDQIVVNVPDDLDVHKIVVGQRPDGVYNQQFRFVDSMSALGPRIPSGARVIYSRGAGQAG